MKSWAIFVTILLGGFMLPRAAEASLELGTTTGLGWNLELPRMSLGVGADVRWHQVHQYPIILDSALFQHGTLIVVQPRLTARFFLSRNRELQPYVVGRVERELPIVISDSGGWSFVTEQNNEWTGELGAGMRTDLNGHVSVGGEFVARVTYYSFPDTQTQAAGSSAFHVFLQYHR